MLDLKKYFLLIIFTLFLGLENNVATEKEAGSIWIKTFKPGSAQLSDPTIDQKALAFVDSLMNRGEIEIEFLGGSDNLRWKQARGTPELSSAWDQAKKLERASRLRERYGRGFIGTTDEPIRGVKVIWRPKKPDIFELNERVGHFENMTDSLKNVMVTLKTNQQKEMIALKDSLLKQEPNMKMTSIAEISTTYFDWEVNSGILFWSAGAPYDLVAPYLGLALNRNSWGIEILGGLTPWSRTSMDGNRGDAFLMGTFNIVPEYWCQFKVGMFSGWEFLTNSDNWTMKVMGVTTGPNFKWKFLNIFAGYNLAKLSTLMEQSRWIHSGIVTASFKLKLTR